MKKALMAAVAAIASLASFSYARADEGVIPLATSGNWLAVAHHTSMTAPPDVCMAANPPSGLGLRADANGVELRISNESWSLPANVEGKVTATIGAWTQTLDIDGNTDTSVNVPLPPASVLTMFAAMDKAGAMTIAVGKAKPIQISLAGSTKVTNAFRTCANISRPEQSAGENPFK